MGRTFQVLNELLTIADDGGGTPPESILEELESLGACSVRSFLVVAAEDEKG